MDIPEHLINAKRTEAPEKIKKFAKEVCDSYPLFMDDIRFSTSVRYFKTVIINTRGTYWANYIAPPINASSFQETILLRFLHEIGHVYNNHPGDAQFDNNGQLIRTQENPFERRELEAWNFAFKLRSDRNQIYQELLKDIELWEMAHMYENKDWENKIDDQLILLSNQGVVGCGEE